MNTITRGAIAITLAATLAVSTAGASSSTVPTSGHILFGRGLNRSTLAVIRPFHKIRQNTRMWYSAYFSQAPGPTIRLALSRFLSHGAIQIVAVISGPMADPTYHLYANGMTTRGLRPSGYRLQITAGSTILATGDFTVTR